MKKKITVCDKCSHEWELTYSDIKTKNWRKGIKEAYLICPACKSKYHIGYTNNRVRKLQGRQRILRREKFQKVGSLVQQLKDEGTYTENNNEEVEAIIERYDKLINENIAAQEEEMKLIEEELSRTP